jgi:hypothetical protein
MTMRSELHFSHEVLKYLTKPKEQQRTTLRSHPSYQARIKHNGVGVAPFDFTGFGQESSRQPGQTCSEEFSVFMGEEKGREEGQVVTWRQKGQAYSGFDVARE